MNPEQADVVNPISSPIERTASERRRSPMSDRQEIIAEYEIHCPASQAERISRDIALEQTVEVPEGLITSQRILDEVVGRVHRLQPLPAGDRFRVTIGYAIETAGFQIPQLLNLVYGNISLKPSVKLIDVELPYEFVSRFRGPNYGVDGIRRLLGVYQRPLLATALKPMGSRPDELAAVARDFAIGGGDLVKDDHNLHDPTEAAFRERIARCQAAVLEANSHTGRNTLYLPNIMAPVDKIEQQVEFAVSQGIRGILISPFLVGFDMVRYLSEKYGLLVMAHPTVSGTFFHDPAHGIGSGLLLGKLFRLIGADASIFPNAGGRFSFTDTECREIARQLQNPLGDLKPAFPAPAGGMRFDNLSQMARQYGTDAIFLIGGALLTHAPSIEVGTRTFLDGILQHFEASTTQPDLGPDSSCELPGGAHPKKADGISQAELGAILQHLSFDNFRWEGREPTVYKASEQLPFQHVSRHELVGKQGEKTAFDLRYFEIGPGGYSSLEKHVHTHTVIAVRGTGTLVVGERRQNLSLYDIAYVPPLMVHQLRNESTEPFGFFCIVDRDRDRPMDP